jgi:hypothetical protein
MFTDIIVKGNFLHASGRLLYILHLDSTNNTQAPDDGINLQNSVLSIFTVFDFMSSALSVSTVFKISLHSSLVIQISLHLQHFALHESGQL